MPFYLLTGPSFPTTIGVLIACITFRTTGITALMDNLRDITLNESVWACFAAANHLIGCSGMLYLAKFPTFYSLPIALALAFTVWGLYFWLHGPIVRGAWGWYLAGSLCMALVVACRPQFIVFSLWHFLFFGTSLLPRKHLFSKVCGSLLCLLAPYARGSSRNNAL